MCCVWVCNRDMTNNRDNLYAAALDAEALYISARLAKINSDDIEAYLEARDEARHERDEAWQAYRDSVFDEGEL